MMNNNEFRFRVQNLSYGWCRVNMLINDKEINFNAGYLGSAELISSHRQRVADVTPHSDEVDKKPP